MSSSWNPWIELYKILLYLQTCRCKAVLTSYFHFIFFLSYKIQLGPNSPLSLKAKFSKYTNHLQHIWCCHPQLAHCKMVDALCEGAYVHPFGKSILETSCMWNPSQKLHTCSRTWNLRKFQIMNICHFTLRLISRRNFKIKMIKTHKYTCTSIWKAIKTLKNDIYSINY